MRVSLRVKSEIMRAKAGFDQLRKLDGYIWPCNFGQDKAFQGKLLTNSRLL